jgi:hypothetical protein
MDTDTRHLDELLAETNPAVGKKLVTEFIKLVRDPEMATSSYPAALRALLDEHLQAVDDAIG